MTKYIIIGSGVAGVSAADGIRKVDPEGLITIFNGEPFPFYYRAALSFYFKDVIPEWKLNGKPFDWAIANKIRILSDKVAKVNVEGKEVIGKSGMSEPYDKLLIATGGDPFMIPVNGADLEGVHTYRGIVCANMKKDYIRKRGVKSAVVIGGGILGIEMAENFCHMGIKTCIIDRAERIMPLLFDETGSDIIREQFESEGVRVLAGEETEEFIGEDGEVTGVKLKSGETIPAKMVIVAAGTRAHTGFLDDSSIEIDRGVVVDENLQTNVEGVYAAGDVSVRKVDGIMAPCRTWLTAAAMGERAGENMAGVVKPFEEKIFFNASHAYKAMYAIVGEFNAKEEDGVRAFSIKPDKHTYRKVFVKDGKVIGGSFINDIAPAWKVYRAMEHDVTLDDKLTENATGPDELLDAMPDLPQLIF